MKRQITIAILTVCALCCFAQTKDVMVIEKNDNTKVQLNVEDIKRVLFESIYANPTGTLAEAVDLGLSSGVKWASWNLGASSKDDFGGYYGWADPTGNKTSQNNNDYPSATPPSEISGTSYDVVRSLWGGEWRLPTKDDVEEIMDECEWYISGKSVEAVGPNGNSILFPIGGSRNGTEIEDVYDYGYYWTGTYLGENTPNPLLLVFDMTETNFGFANADRHYGLSIRPVFGKPIKISITTVTASDITESGATLSGHVSGESSAITVGFIYGTTNNLSSTNGTRKSTTAIGGYSVPLSNLNAGTTYYYRAYAVYKDRYYYGETKNFTTKEKVTTGTLNGHDWVDLGLPSGTKWATANIGASKPEYYGWYIAWGETTKKSSYTWNTYKYGSDNGGIIRLTKYNCTNGQGTVDNKSTLDMSDDAARVNWGSTWRMPTREEMKELWRECKWQWTTKNGINGYEVKSKVNSNSIFLPAAGLMGESFGDDSAGKGYYWTNTLNTADGCIDAYCLGFESNGLYSIDHYSSPRSLGQMIRPVTKY